MERSKRKKLLLSVLLVLQILAIALLIAIWRANSGIPEVPSSAELDSVVLMLPPSDPPSMVPSCTSAIGVVFILMSLDLTAQTDFFTNRTLRRLLQSAAQ